MALKDIFHFMDDKLEEAFNAKPRDAARARRPLLKGLDAARDQFEEGRAKGAGRWWTSSNDVVAFAPKISGTPLVINGKTTNFIAADRFAAFLAAMRAEVEGGEFDAMIEAIENGTGNAGSSVEVKAGGRGSRGPMSEQAKANIRAGRARAKAAREGAANG